jgi:hypothetical protein
MKENREQRSLSASTFVVMLLPGVSLVACLFFLAMLALFDAYQWYEAAANAYQPAAWYAYPWHWPGVHLAEQGWIWLRANVSLFNFPTGESGKDLSNLPLVAIFWLLRAATALIINTAIALLPLLVLGRLVTLAKWVRNRLSATA